MKKLYLVLYNAITIITSLVLFRLASYKQPLLRTASVLGVAGIYGMLAQVSSWELDDDDSDANDTVFSNTVQIPFSVTEFSW